MAGRVEDRAVERAVRVAKERARDDVQLLVAAGRKLLHRDGAAEMTIADVLSEAGLSTRAFYRHFASKSDLLLAIYDHEVERYRPLLQRRLDAAATPREGLVAWIDELLAAGFEPRRGERTRAMFTWAIPLQQEFPAEFAAVRAALTDPLVAVLEAGRVDGTFPNTEPERDAPFIRALTWDLVEEHLSGVEIDPADARDQVLRFCLPALGATR
jgi:AcrR family transcriptional regulator